MRRKDFDQARKLRLLGASYNQINKELGIPKGTLSNWFSNSGWSEKIKTELSKRQRTTSSINAKKMAEQNKINFAKKILKYRRTAKAEYPQLKNDPIFQAGIMLYLGEGDNKFDHSLVRVSNINPKIISIFMKFLRKICEVNKKKIRPTIILYDDLNEQVCKNYWNKFLDLPLENFYKTQYIIGRHKKRKLSYGICNVSVSDRSLKEKIFVWTEMLSKDLLGKRV